MKTIPASVTISWIALCVDRRERLIRVDTNESVLRVVILSLGHGRLEVSLELDQVPELVQPQLLVEILVPGSRSPANLGSRVLRGDDLDGGRNFLHLQVEA